MRRVGSAEALCLLVAASLGLFGAVPLLNPFFIGTFDGYPHLFRSFALDRALAEGVILPRWNGDLFLGYGFPVFNFYPPLTYYLAAAFHGLGLGYVAALKAVAVFTLAASAAGAYLYTRTFLHQPAALLAAALYATNPYAMFNLYYRGAFPELLALVWFPPILWAFGRICARPRPGYVLIGALGYAGLILTHNVSALLFSPFLVVYCLIAATRPTERSNSRSPERPRRMSGLAGASLAIGLGLALSAFYWLPALAEMNQVQIDRLRMFDYRASLMRLTDLVAWNALYPYPAVAVETDIGHARAAWPQVIAVVFGTVGLVLRRHRRRARAWREGLFAVLAAGGAILLMLDVSFLLWDRLPLLSISQFAWRFLTVLALPSAVLGGIAAEYLVGRGRGGRAMSVGRNGRLRLPRGWPVVGAIAAVVFVSTIGLRPFYTTVGDDWMSLRGLYEFDVLYNGITIGTTSTGEYLPMGVRERPFTSPLAAALFADNPAPAAYRIQPAGAARVEILERRTARNRFRLTAAAPADVVFPIVYFPGWQANFDGRPTEITVTEPEGFIAVTVPAGGHDLTLEFGPTPIRILAERLALGALALAVLLAIVHAIWRRPGTQPRRPRLPVARDRGVTPALIALSTVALLLLAACQWHARRYQMAMTMEQPLAVHVGAQATLLGADLLPPSRDGVRVVRPGEQIGLVLTWQPGEHAIRHTYRVVAGLTNKEDGIWWARGESETVPIVSIDRPQNTGVALVVPPGTPPGVYRLEAHLISADTSQPLKPTEFALAGLMPLGDRLQLGPFTVQASREPSLPPAEMIASFEDGLVLVGAELRDAGMADRRLPGLTLPASGGVRAATAGDTLDVDLTWLVAQGPTDDHTVNAQLVDDRGFLWASAANRSRDGLYPTYLWQPGELVRNQILLRVPPETPPGRYGLRIEVRQHERALSVLDRNRAPAGTIVRLMAVDVIPSDRPAADAQPPVDWRHELPLTPEIGLLGYQVSPPELQPGQSLHINAYWLVRRQPTQDLTAGLELTTADGQTVAAVVEAPVGSFFPTSQWRSGDVLRGQYRLPIPAAVGPGDLTLSLSLRSPGNAQPLAAAEIGRIRVAERPQRPELPLPKYPLSTRFGDAIGLIGYDLSPDRPVNAGQPFAISLHWQAERTPAMSYAVSVQVLDRAGRLVAQHDGPPGNGSLLTTGWLPGEVIADDHVIHLPENVAPGQYRLIAVVYDPADGRRLPVGAAGDFAQIGSIAVVPP